MQVVAGERYGVDRAADQVRSGEPFSVLLDSDAEQRAAALDAVLKQVVDDGTRLVWAGNPLRSPLTMERLLLQIVGPEIDLRIERSPAQLARILTQPIASESRLLIVVQQPETMNVETRETLGALAGDLEAGPVQVQFLFVGLPNFESPAVSARKPPMFVATPAPAPEPDLEPASYRPRRRDVLPLLLLLLVLVLGVMISSVPVSPTTLPGPSLGIIDPAHAMPAAQSTPISPPAAVPDEMVRLRNAFDTFLAQRASTLPPMSDSQKDALFNDFLTHHHRE